MKLTELSNSECKNIRGGSDLSQLNGFDYSIESTRGGYTPSDKSSSGFLSDMLLKVGDFAKACGL